MSPMNLVKSIPPETFLEFKSMVLTINVHTPSKLSVHLLTTGVGDRFKRNTDHILGNQTVREKVIHNGRDSRVDIMRQSIYVEHVRELPEVGWIRELTYDWWGWLGQYFGKKKLPSICESEPHTNNLPNDAVDGTEAKRLKLIWETRWLKKGREMHFTMLATPIDCLGITRFGAMVTWSMNSVPMFSTVDQILVWRSSTKTCRWSCLIHM